MPLAQSLRRLSRAEKLRVMDALWADLSKDDSEFKSPGWHREALRDAERRVKSGAAKFSNWEQAKERIRRRAAKAK